MTSTDGTRARSPSTSPRSISRATTRPARRASSPVRAPAPGPISRTRSWVVGARRSTIAQATPASRRKCWPSARRLVARTPPRLEVGEERLVDPAHLGDRRLAVARVVDDVVRDLRLLRDRQLARDPPLGLRGAEPVARREAPDLRRLVGDDHDETVHGRGVPALDDQGRVEDDDAGETAGGELLEPPGEPLADPRVGDRLEALALLGNGEDDDAELLPVERSVALEDPPPKLGDDVVVGGLAGRDHLAREHVSVDDHAPETTEDLGDGGFAGRDAPGQSHEQKLPGHTSAQSGPDFTSTTTGTWSGSAASMISRASASTAAISSGGASKRSSSWTWSSIRARSRRASRASCVRTIAILIMSLAVPWTGAFMAMRSAALRGTGVALLRSGRERRRWMSSPRRKASMIAGSPERWARMRSSIWE